MNIPNRKAPTLLKKFFLSCLLLTTLSAFGAQTITAEQTEELSQLFEYGDYQSLRSSLTPLTEVGDINVQYNLGALYANGREVSKDLSKTREL